MSTFRAKQLIKDNLNIPTMPEVLMRVGQLLDDPDCGTHEVGAVVAEDAPLAAKVLRIANSAFYGLREQCLSAEQACGVLGMRVLRNVVMQAAVIQQFSHLEGNGAFDLDGLWRHSILTAQASAFISKRSSHEFELASDEFHICGLLHDIGKIVLLDGLGRDYAEVCHEAREGGELLHVVERRRLEFDHCDIGAMVAVRWGLPTAAVAAIQFHHGSAEQIASDPVVGLVASANELAQHVGAGRREAAEAAFERESARFLQLDRATVDEVVEFAFEAFGSVEV